MMVAGCGAGCGAGGTLTATFEQNDVVVAELDIDCSLVVSQSDPTDPSGDFFDVTGRDVDRGLGIVITWFRDQVPGPGTYDDIGRFTVLWPNPASTGPTDQELTAYGTVTFTAYDAGADAAVAGTFEGTVPALDPIRTTGAFDCARAN
jgi:hypothetical protein